MPTTSLEDLNQFMHQKMFERLQKKWKVNGVRLTFILITFAVGGSLTGYVARKLMPFFNIDQRWLWIVLYIILVTLLWPFAVLLISVFTGQFTFFRSYIRKMGVRMKIIRPSPVLSSEVDTNRAARLAIFASGAGSNAQKIIEHFRNETSVIISLIVCNNPQAGVLKIAEKENIPCIIIEKDRFFRGDGYLSELNQKKIDLIILAGFLWKLPSKLVDAFPRKIINIHPALLPKYGGKGMYGSNVHAAVIAAGDKESGITIHYVDEHYDNGDIILQVKCPVLLPDTPDSLAQRIHQLEHKHYPIVIEKLLKKK